MILVTGGTGFVGRHMVAGLLERGEQVRVLSRSGAELPGAQAVTGDVTDPEQMMAAVRGCYAVIHLVGIIRERGGATFQRVHVDGTRAVIQACEASGVGRLLHMSALGTRPDARSQYHRTKWQAEELVRDSGLRHTIFRPSIMFGAGSGFFPQLRDLVRRGPVIPIIGDGRSLLQPVWVRDVASCFAGALERPQTEGRTYELAGPDRFSFEQLVDLVAADEGVRKRKVHLPLGLMRPVAWLGSRVYAGFPLTPDQLLMLREDNVCDIEEMIATFGLQPAPLPHHLRD